MESTSTTSSDHNKMKLGSTIHDESKSYNIEDTFTLFPSIGKYKSWEECKSTSILSIPNEPTSYKMEDASLLELNEENWKNIWEEHIQYRDTFLKKMNFDSYKGRLNGVESAHSAHYINSIHLNFKLVKLERILQKLKP
uniref:Uncharacterized protein n=1 Tax=Pithovirus LCPAC401 TaxID=2506595 RepID=A0A481ZAT9_9VIRU|nr:MAG: uncharacterized protein LCPAC401_02230 [Pithovirus LCPAC401]